MKLQVLIPNKQMHAHTLTHRLINAFTTQRRPQHKVAELTTTNNNDNNNNNTTLSEAKNVQRTAQKSTFK